MVNGLSDLLKSERGVFCILALMISAVMVAVGKMSADSWVDFMKYLTGVLVASKTVTTAVERYRRPRPDDPSEVPPARVVE